MLKRFFISWLIICTVGYGSAWAFDGHAEERAQHHMVVGDTAHTPDDGGEHPSCDHGCHASAHTMALWSVYSSAVLPGSTTGRTPYQTTLSSNNTSPPEHPPRS